MNNRPKSNRSSKRNLVARFEQLEKRQVLSGLSLTPLVQVSDPSPLDPTIAPNGRNFPNSEVEPQIAVDPNNLAHAVAIWQQDRYSGTGSRALVVSVSNNANAAGGATWSAPAAIPGFNAAIADPAYGRYSDPWVSFAPNGDLFASALAVSIAGGFPSRSAILVSKSTDGGHTWSNPTTLIDTQVPPGTDPVDLLNDKEAVTADPTKPGYAYVIWDRLNHPADDANFNAFHGFGFRGDTLFARTTDGGATWEPARVLFAPQANEEWIGHQIVVMPTTSAHPGRLVDAFSLEQGSGSQGIKSARDKLAVIYSDDQGATWSQPVIVADQFDQVVTDPDTGAPVRVGEPIPDIAVDPHSGNLFVVWDDARFSQKYTHDSIALSESTDGGLTWSNPIAVNQTPTNIDDGDQQAFIPSVAVANNGTVAVTYYDFRNNTSAAGLPADVWLVHASSNFADPASWTADEKRLTNASFNMENAPVASGYFVGDYAGLAAAGNSFYALFGQAGADASDPSNIWFRDPPPAPPLAASLASSAMTPLLLFGNASQSGAIAAPSLVSHTLYAASSTPPSAPTAARLSDAVSARYTPAALALEANLAAADQSFATGDWDDNLALADSSSDALGLSFDDGSGGEAGGGAGGAAAD